MRRDMDLIRAMMLQLEALPLPAGTVYSLQYDGPELAVDGYTPDEIFYHMNLIHDGRLTEPFDGQGMTSLTFSGFTWKGHDFLDSVRDPAVWTQTKSTLEKVGGWTLDLLLATAKAYLKAKVSAVIRIPIT